MEIKSKQHSHIKPVYDATAGIADGANESIFTLRPSLPGSSTVAGYAPVVVPDECTRPNHAAAATAARVSDAKGAVCETEFGTEPNKSSESRKRNNGEAGPR